MTLEPNEELRPILVRFEHRDSPPTIAEIVRIVKAEARKRERGANVEIVDVVPLPTRPRCWVGVYRIVGGGRRSGCPRRGRREVRAE